MRIAIDDLTDPRLDCYRRLKDRRLAEHDGRFVAESKRLTQRLLESALRVESVLVDERRADEIAAITPDDVPLYVITAERMSQLAGFAIHTGVLSVGFRPGGVTVDTVMRDVVHSGGGAHSGGGPVTWIVAPMLKEPENVGSLVRTAAAFGVTGLVLGPQCCDPFYRRAARVSMGSVFRLPIVRSDDIAADLRRLQREHAVQCIAATLNDAEPLHEATRPQPPAPDRIALVLGHEVDGLPPEVEALCDRRVTLPMQRGTDSLNVTVAAAVFCYHFIRPRSGSPPAADALSCRSQS